MWSNPQETADLVAFTEEILNGKLHFLCSGFLSHRLICLGFVFLVQFERTAAQKSCLKSARIRRFSGPHIPALGLNTDIFFPFQSECGKMWARKSAVFFHSVLTRNISKATSSLIIWQKFCNAGVIGCDIFITCIFKCLSWNYLACLFLNVIWFLLMIMTAQAGGSIVTWNVFLKLLKTIKKCNKKIIKLIKIKNYSVTVTKPGPNLKREGNAQNRKKRHCVIYASQHLRRKNFGF